MISGKFDISWQTLWKIFAFGLLIILGYLARPVLGVLFVSIVISLGLDAIVSFLERHRVNRILGTSMIFIVVALGFSTITYFVLPLVYTEAASFIQHFNKTLSLFLGFKLPAGLIKDFAVSLDSAFGFLSAANISIAGAIGTAFSRVVLVLSTITISFYLTVDKDGPARLLRMILPDVYERPIMAVFDRFKSQIRYWLGAQLILSVIVGFIVSIGMWLLGVPYALVLGLLAAVFELVPIIGPILIGAIAFLVAVGNSLTLGLYALLFFFLVQQLENHVLTPLVMKRIVNVHPVVVVISLLAGGHIAGFIGILLAVPIAVLAQVIIHSLAEYKERRPALGI